MGLIELSSYLRRKGAFGRELVANEITGGDMRNIEEFGEAAGVGALSDARAAEKHPLHIPSVTTLIRSYRGR